MKHLAAWMFCFSAYGMNAQVASWVNYTANVSVVALANDDQATWVGTQGGLVRIDLTTGVRTHFNKSNSGLPANSVNDITLGDNGNVWVGTSRGLAHFDGTNWTSYTTNNSDLLEEAVWKVAAAPDGSVWLSSQYTGDIQHLSSGTWTTINSGATEIRALACMPNGDLLMGTGSSGLHRYDGSTWTTWNTGNSTLPSNSVSAIAITASGTAFLNAGAQLVGFSGTDFTTYPIAADALYSSSVDRVTLDDDGICHVTTAPVYIPFPIPSTVRFPRCLRLANGVWEDLHHYGFPGLPFGPLGPITVDGNGIVWTGVNELTSLTGNTWTTEQFRSTVFNQNGFSAMHVDAQGVVWAGGQGYPAELYSFDGTSWSEFADGQSIGLIRDITTDVDGNPILATDNGLWRYSAGVWEVLTPDNSPLPSSYIEQVFFDNDQNLWIVPAEGGLYRYNGSWLSYNTNNSSLSSNDVNCIAQDANGVYWIGTGNGAAGGGGISRFDGTTWTTWTPTNSNLPNNLFVPSITINSAGVPTFMLYFTDEPEQLATFSGSSFVFADATNTSLPAGFTSISTDAADVQWLTTPFDGLFYKLPTASAWSVFNVDNSGLAWNAVQAIDFAANGDVWIGTGNGGINRLTVDFFESVTDNSTTATGITMVPSVAHDHTELLLDLASMERSTIDVVDASGRVVHALGMRNLPAGVHRIGIDTIDLPAGTYACRISGSASRSARFIVRH